MKSIIFKGGISLFILFFIFQSVQIVHADDDHDREHDAFEREEGDFFESDDDHSEREEHEYEEEKDDDEEEYEQGEEYESNNGSSSGGSALQGSYWYIWTRDVTQSDNSNLPFQEAKDITIQLSNRSESFYVIPQNGQFLVSGEKMAKLLGAKFKFYEQSKILELTKGTEKLIVRAGTNAAYENMVKTPMPSRAFYYEKSVYMPVSVITNAFNYRISWDGEKAIFILEEL